MPVPSRVLLAHYDAAERERLTRFLREGGAEVFVASDGAQARALAAKHGPSLALLTCMLPGVSGFEVCRGLGEAGAGVAPVPVVLLSDAEDPYVRARARHVGAKRVVFGSVSSAQVKELLDEEFAGSDPLDVAAGSTGKGREDHLFDDLLSARKPTASKVRAPKIEVGASAEQRGEIQRHCGELHVLAPRASLHPAHG